MALTTEEAAAWIGCSPALLRVWRRVGNGPSFYRVGRLVRYREVDVETWISVHREGGDSEDAQSK